MQVCNSCFSIGRVLALPPSKRIRSPKCWHRRSIELSRLWERNCICFAWLLVNQRYSLSKLIFSVRTVKIPSSYWHLELAKTYLSDHINCECIAGLGDSHVLRSLCLREPDNFLHVGRALMRGILTTGLPAVRAFGCPGVHHVVAASCVFFLRVLATGFVLLVISHAHICRHVMLVSQEDKLVAMCSGHLLDFSYG